MLRCYIAPTCDRRCDYRGHYAWAGGCGYQGTWGATVFATVAGVIEGNVHRTDVITGTVGVAASDMLGDGTGETIVAIIISETEAGILEAVATGVDTNAAEVGSCSPDGNLEWCTNAGENGDSAVSATRDAGLHTL